MSPFLSMVIMIHMKQQLHLPCVLVSVLIIQQQWLLYPSFHGSPEGTAALARYPSFCVNYFTVVAVISQFLW